MASTSSSSHQIAEITTCSICLGAFVDPKVLPCIHTYCLKCLDSYCANKKQDEMTCPLCRKSFSIPSCGIQNLPDNHFILQLLSVNKSHCNTESHKSVKPLPCELCSDSDSEIASTSYCSECDQHICDRCSVAHGKIKSTKSHLVVRGANTESTHKRIKLEMNYCDEHPCDRNRLYCYDCKTIMCNKCLSKHSQHKLSDVDEACESFRHVLKDDIDLLSTCIDIQQTDLKQLGLTTKVFLTKATSLESEVSQRCDKLISLIQSRQTEMIGEICQFKDKKLKEVETVKDEIERQLVITEGFMRYCQEIINKGTACDISRTAHDLHARAEELVKTQVEFDDHKLSGVLVRFIPSTSRANSVKNFIGELNFEDDADSTNEDDAESAGEDDAESASEQDADSTCEDNANLTSEDENNEEIDLTSFLTQPKLLHVLPHTGEPVAGITVLGDEVFIVRCRSPVKVYNSGDFSFKRNLMITGSHDLKGIVSCSLYDCLYVIDTEQKIIYRHDLTDKVTTKWSVDGECFKLSVASGYNVLATLQDTDRVQEYTTHGSLVRVISLASSIVNPYHCVQLSNGNVVISNIEGGQKRVSILDKSERIVQSYSGYSGSGVVKLNKPYHLTIDDHDNVLVADGQCNKFLLLSPTLTYLGDIVIPEYRVNDPYVVYLDEENGRLYIGEWEGGNIFVLGA